MTEPKPTPPEVIAMARRIVKSDYPEMPANCTGRRLQIAIAAIQQTTAAAASHMFDWYDSCGSNALRNFEHLKGRDDA